MLTRAGATRFSRPYNSHYDNKHTAQKNYGKHSRPGESNQYFLGKGQKKAHLLQQPNLEDIIQSLENIKKSVREFPSLVRDLKEYLETRCTNFRAGCITKSIRNWQITSDKEILTSIRGATTEFDTRPFNTTRPQSIFSVEESAIIDNEVAKLLSKNIVETTDHDSYEVISPIFIRPKKDGGHRLILNLKRLNQFVTYHHFKDVYYTVGVNTSHGKYLRFIWKNVLYQFTCLPHGLSSCPRKFTQLLKPPLTERHKKGHISASYIDDLYLQGRTYDLCVSNVIDTFIQFDTMGFTIHPEKSVFIPSQRFVLLGFIIDSVAMTITLTPEKALKVKEACATLLGQGPTTIRRVACVIGKIIS